MYKKLLISAAVLVIAIFTFSICFANDNNGMQDAVNGVRNIVGDAENAVEDGVRDIANTSREATGDMEQAGNTAGNNNSENANGNAMMNNNDNNNNSKNDNNSTKKDTNNETGSTGIMDSNYTATRTSATDNTFMGMNSTAWTWLIIGIAAIAIVALVWYYSIQMRSSNYDNKD